MEKVSNVNSFCCFLLCKSQNDDGSICFPFSGAQNVDILISHMGSSHCAAGSGEWGRTKQDRKIFIRSPSTYCRCEAIYNFLMFVHFFFALRCSVSNGESFLSLSHSKWTENHLSWPSIYFASQCLTFFSPSSDSLFIWQDGEDAWRAGRCRECFGFRGRTLANKNNHIGGGWKRRSLIRESAMCCELKKSGKLHDDGTDKANYFI